MKRLPSLRPGRASLCPERLQVPYYRCQNHFCHLTGRCERIGARHTTHRVLSASRRVSTVPRCSPGLSYKGSGVDIDAGNELVQRIKKLNPAIGGFSGCFPFGDSYLVAGTDGVGTKLKLAFDMNNHSTIGIDLVAMCVNDIVTAGAQPLFFLDYYATGKLDVDCAEDVVKGIVEGCKMCGATLMGGETAEMPGFYSEGEYDVAGFAVGAVKKDRLVDGSGIQHGNVLLGLPSSGVHSNGFSLVRKILEVSGTSLKDPAPWDQSISVGDALLTPTIIYVNDVIKVHETVGLLGAVHITGEGLPGNLPRVVRNGCACRIDRSSWIVPPLFQWLQKAGGVSDAEMFRTFNMGVGMVMVVAADAAQAVLDAGIGAFVLGEVVEGEGVMLE